jgi:ADP-ribose pyrophosphatase YjhB (NUDIX family)
VEGHGGEVLICRPQDDPGRRFWEFPGGQARSGESPEAAMRRLAKERTGVHVEIHVGQPPLPAERDGSAVEYRCFLCGLSAGDAQPLDYAEVRWVAKGQLCEYDFDPITKRIVDWYTK